MLASRVFSLIRIGLLALAVGGLAGCGSSGSDGAPGANGANGTNGANGANGATGATGAAGATGATGAQGVPGLPGANGVPVTDGSKLTGDNWALATLVGTVTSSSVGTDGKPVANFYVTNMNTGAPVKGLTSSNLGFAVAKLQPATTTWPSQWVSYVVVNNAGTTLQKPSTDSYVTGTTGLVDNGDGTYQYTFNKIIDGRATTSVQAIVAASTDTATNLKADLGDLSYNANYTHRIGVQISGSHPGTAAGTTVSLRTPTNAFRDFIPATGAAVAVTDTSRDIVAISACLSCHSKFTFHGGSALTGVGGSRQEVKFCVLCHTDQRKYSVAGVTSAVGTATTVDKVDGISLKNIPVFVHKIHMGSLLVKTTTDSIAFNGYDYSQDVRNCTKCHDGTATAANYTKDGDNFKTKPSRLACGACHDGINFATGTGTGADGRLTGHGYGGVGGAQANDANCTTCHTPAGILLSHKVATPLDPCNALAPAAGCTANANTNASALTGTNAMRLPDGAVRVTYDLSTVTMNATRQPVFKFRLMDSTSGTATALTLNAQPAAADATVELLPNFIGSPSAYFVAALPQDGIAKPADFNISASAYIRNCWNKTATTGTSACTMTAGTGTDLGYYLLTLTGVQIPTTAVMMTGGLGYTYSLPATQPLTQTNVGGFAYSATTKVGGLSVPATNVAKVVTGTLPTGFATQSARRVVVETARCNNCHNSLGIFAEKAFHAGQRNDAPTCSFCHNPNRASSGWSAASTTFIHGIHGKDKRTVPFTWHAADTATPGVYKDFSGVGYPGQMRNCQQCHVANAVNFGISANATAANGSNLPYATVATGRFATTLGATTTSYTYTAGACVAGVSATAQTAVGAYSLSPYVVALGNNVSFGNGFTANLGTTATTTACTADGVAYSVAAGKTREADGNSLVNSPIANACFGCHTSDSAMAHMSANGGKLYVTRASVTSGGKLVNSEQCMVCHAPGKVADTEVIHKP